MSLVDNFYKDIRIKRDGDWINIDCPLGLWGVTTTDEEAAIREAQHYYMQYSEDGEYDHLRKEDL